MTRELACLVLAMDELDATENASAADYSSGMARVMAYLRGRRGRRLDRELESRIDRLIQQYSPTQQPAKPAKWEKRREEYLRAVGRTEGA